MARARKAKPDAVTEALKTEFDAAHEAGEKALKTRDFDALARAIERERDLISQQKAHIENQRAERARRDKSRR
jgi:hypothetical protein